MVKSLVGITARVLCVLAFLGATVASSAAVPPEEGADETNVGQSPRSALRAFFDACRAGDYRQAAAYMDFSGVEGSSDETRRQVLARHLQVSLDRGLWIDLESMSDDPEGNPDDELPRGVDRAGVVEVGAGKVDVLVQRSRGGERLWQFAPSTVRRIPVLYDKFGYGALGEVLPERYFILRFLGIEMWQWLGLGLLIPLAWVVGYVVTRLAHRVVRPLVARTPSDIDDRLVVATYRPLRWIVTLACFAAGVMSLGLSIPVRDFIGTLEKVLLLFFVVWLALRVIDVIFEGLRARLLEERRTNLAAMLPHGRKAVKALAIGLGFIVMLQHLGVSVAGLVAGLGIGGLGIALAIQKTAENFFGGVALSADQPVRVGDLCKFGDRVGHIEDVGFRSTRIRTLDRTLVTVPNGQFSQMEIENYAVRDRIRLVFVLGLRYETTPDQLRFVLAGLRQLLAAHPRIHAEAARVRFIAFGPHSLDVEVFAYVTTTDGDEFLAVREDVFLRVMDLVSESGTGFAFPSQTLYLGRDDGRDEERSQAAEQVVRGWREAGRLPFPDLAPREKAELSGSLDYPPKGSVVQGAAT